MKKLIYAAAAGLAAILTSATVSQAEDLVFTLTNKTTGTLERFYSSPVGVDEWEEDVFGKDTLGPGESMKITIADGRDVCKYDMRFEFTDDSGFENMEDTQDLCAMGSYTIHQ